jgi:CRP-like cAMP-binding protein
MPSQNQSQTLLQIVSKLKIFQGLSPREAGLLLKFCVSQTIQPSEVVYQVGAPSQDLFILLQGLLKVVGKSGTALGEILPGTCCGEMGVFTGLPRTATIVASQKSVGFSITKQDLQKALQSDPNMHIKVLQNVIVLLTERLTAADGQIEDLAGKLRQAKDESGQGS